MDDWRRKYWRYMGALGMVTAYKSLPASRLDQIAKERGFANWLEVLSIVENGEA